MAGVGRRGFQAAALAAMSAAAFYGQPSPTMDYHSPPSMGGRRAHAPRYLDIDAARRKYSFALDAPRTLSLIFQKPQHHLCPQTPTPLLHTLQVPYRLMHNPYNMTGTRSYLVLPHPRNIPTPNGTSSLRLVCRTSSLRIFQRHRKHHWQRQSRPNYHSLRNTRTNCLEAILTFGHPNPPLFPTQPAHLPLQPQVPDSQTRGARSNLKVAILRLDQTPAEEVNHGHPSTDVMVPLAQCSPKAQDLVWHTPNRLTTLTMRSNPPNRGRKRSHLHPR